MILLHVSTKQRSHLQGAAVLEDTCIALCNFSSVNGEIYTCRIIPQLINNYNTISLLYLVKNVPRHLVITDFFSGCNAVEMYNCLNILCEHHE